MRQRDAPTPGIPLVAFLLPFAVLAVTGYGLRADWGARSGSVLAVGVVVLLVLAAVGPMRSVEAAERYADARRVVLRALFATMLLFSLCCAWIAVKGLDGALDVWPGIVFVPGWFLFALLIPLWTDSPVVRTEAPETGWISIGGFKLLYSNPDDSALWVYMAPQIPGDLRSVLYTPNLGHRWGRLAMTTFVVLILAMVGILVAASRANGLLP